jgi:hypothetical protein
MYDNLCHVRLKSKDWKTNKMKKKKYHTVGTVPKSNRKIVKRGTIDISNTLKHDRSLSKQYTVSSIAMALCTI